MGLFDEFQGLDELKDANYLDYELAKKNLEEERKQITECINSLLYDSYFTEVLVKEQPYYHDGMTTEEIIAEIEYINHNLRAFYEGYYEPLWKQSLRLK